MLGWLSLEPGLEPADAEVRRVMRLDSLTVGKKEMSCTRQWNCPLHKRLHITSQSPARTGQFPWPLGKRSSNFDWSNLTWCTLPLDKLVLELSPEPTSDTSRE
ncbi:hypothetical protein I7I48_00456 [Histoplasma ohiense]|nr:hypothetical protein I7I48_00456 [Histoplasma ohiense (nom. inval.)]